MYQRVHTSPYGLNTPTFMGRLRHDTKGNTLMIVAAAIIPLTAMIGAGVDVSRTFMIKSRLQQACDAGALATRKSMGGGITITTQASQNGQNFFNNNFPAGAFGTSNISFTTSLNPDNQVMAAAAARVPQTIMTVFGNNYTDLSVRCDAKLEVANTDIMFVLDTTGSMNSCPNGSDCGGGAGSKIVGLRQAVMDFYDTIDGASSADSQIRFGFVPYSTSVNVGDLLPSTYFNSNRTYQSAIANMTTPYYQPTPGAPTSTVETYASTLSRTNCNTYGANKSYPALDGSVFNTGGPSPADTTKTVYSFKDWGATGTTSGTRRTCRRNKTVTVTTYPLVGYTLTNWTFKPVSYDLTTYKTGSSLTLANGDPAGYMPTSGSYNLAELAAAPTAGTGNVTADWDKCIEERDTVTQTTFSPIPSAAYDLQIDLIPSSTATRWNPTLPEAVYIRANTANENRATLKYYDGTNLVWNGENLDSQPAHACPSASQKLLTMGRGEVQTYVDNLNPTGYTYHDIGMAWGARLISPTGMFAAENVVAANGRPISRHIIYMTDGDMCPNPTWTTFQGYERLDRRVMGTTAPSNCSGEIITRHDNRFLALCEAAKSMNISVWTVAFGTSNPPTLVSCANANQAFVATDTATLRTQFQAIAARIASLRLSK